MNSAPEPKGPSRHTRRVPTDSFFYEKLFPVILIALGILTVALIFIAGGVLLGIIHYR